MNGLEFTETDTLGYSESGWSWFLLNPELFDADPDPRIPNPSYIESPFIWIWLQISSGCKAPTLNVNHGSIFVIIFYKKKFLHNVNYLLYCCLIKYISAFFK